MMSNGDLTFLRNNVWRIYSSIKRRRLIEYSKVNLTIMEFLFLQKFIPVLKMKIHGLMVLVFRYSFLTDV